MAFKGAYKSIYEAGLARLRERETERKAKSLAGAARAGVRTSGVSQIPLTAIARESAGAEQRLGADVAGMEETERLQKIRFGERKELLTLSGTLAEAAEERAAKRRRAAGKSQLIGSLYGGVLSGLGSYLRPGG